jgi:hypothetical protein
VQNLFFKNSKQQKRIRILSKTLNNLSGTPAGSIALKLLYPQPPFRKNLPWVSLPVATLAKTVFYFPVAITIMMPKNCCPPVTPAG